MRNLVITFLLSLFCANLLTDETYHIIDKQIAAHPKLSGIYVLDKGEEALLARVWLADHAQKNNRGAILYLEHR